MQLSDLVTDVEKLTNISSQSALVKRALGRALDRVSGTYPWPFYLDRSFITTVDDYSTGTVAITQGEKAVTGTSTVFTSAMVGRKIRVGSDQAYYTIASFTSTTAITLLEPYQGSTVTAATYVVYQDEYRLQANVDLIHFMKQIETGQALIDLDPGDYDLIWPTGNSYGDPSYVIPIGRRQDTYATGTVTGSVSSTSLTGSSTSWTSEPGISRGTRIRIGNYVYTVKSVDSDTAITLYEGLVVAASSSAYTAYLDNARIQLYQLPDAQKNIVYRFYRRPAPLVNDYDEPDLPPSFHWLLIHGALSELWAYKGDDNRRVTVEQTFAQGIQQMKMHFNNTTRIYRRRSQTETPLMRGPRYPSNFDISVAR